MAIVSFTLTDDGVVAFQNALACILRFSEDVSLDTRRDKLILSALNGTKTAFVSFAFSAAHFAHYRYEGGARAPDKFFCSILIRALLSIFRSRTGGDASRGGGSSADSSIERCDVAIEDGPGQKSRFVAKIAWRNGITATHAIPFEAKSPIVAKFDESKAENRWSISAHTLRRLMDHFGPKVELLDINTEGSGVLNLTCFTERQYSKTDGALLNMNLHTSIAVKMDDFDDMDVEDKHHIIINVKDLRAILQHACTTSAGSLSACYSEPWHPLRFSYAENGLYCQFVLMTLGEKADAAAAKRPKARVRSAAAAAASRGPVLVAASAASAPAASAPAAAPTPAGGHAEPRRPLAEGGNGAGPSSAPSASDAHAGFDMRPPPPPPPSALRMEALMDDDRQWEPVNPDEDNSGFVQIEWDESLQPELAFVPISNGHEVEDHALPQAPPADLPGALEPTQRLTQVRKFGLFD